MFRTCRRIIIVTALAGLIPYTVAAQSLKLTFDDVIRGSDLIFIGTASSEVSRLNDAGTMIFTDVTFTHVRVVASTDRSVQKQRGVVVLTLPGGRVGNVEVNVSATPRFITGKRYLLFTRDDGTTYLNPLIGGDQGRFEVVADSEDPSRSFVLTSGGKAITGLTPSGLQVSERPTLAIRNGAIVAAPTGGLFPKQEAPLPADPKSGSASALMETMAQGGLALPLDSLLAYVAQAAANRPAKTPEPDLTQGYFYTVIDGEPYRSELPSRPPRTVALRELAMSVENGEVNLDPGGTLGACGYHSLPLVMEQVPDSWWSYAINNDCMWTWNQFMDVYRFTADDGSYGHNGTNEFAGFVSSSALLSTYGFSWGSGLAMTITWMGFLQPTCGSIAESDLLWNSAYSWTNDAGYALGNSSVLLLRPINMHELGHTWGEQRGSYTETYDYDVATVMQPYYYDVVEDGWGIHASDAYLFRRQYSNQTSILSISDVGVESYWASNGLNNSYTNVTSCHPGDSITINNVTVENMSYSALSDVRIRFYLSTDRTVSTSDYQLGSYWYWSTFSGESTSVATYTTSVPFGIPAGQYYVGAIVTINGFGTDGYSWNDTTTLYTPITVTAAAPGAFYKSAPANGATGQSTSPTLSWGTSSGATSYEYCVNTSTSCSSWTSVGTATSATASGLGTGTTYYWQVRARNAAGTTDANSGSWWSFTTQVGLPGSFNKSAPTNGATGQATSLTLSWGTSSGATSY
jgi:hypothetical protein